MQGIYEMSKMKDINGIDTLLRKLPENFQKWHYFNHIDEFKYETVFDDTDKFENINNIEMVISDCSKKYWIKMKLTNVSGLISFIQLMDFTVDLLLMILLNVDTVKTAAIDFQAVKWILILTFTAKRFLLNYYINEYFIV